MIGRPVRGLAAVLALGVAIGCAGGSTPETAPDPSRAVRVLAATDADLMGISLAAAADVKEQRGGDEIAFQGVFVNEREVRAVSDSVIRAHGLTRGEATGTRVPFVVCRLGSPCPEMAGAQPMKTPVAFTSFRIARDSAYVGGTWLVRGAGRPPRSEAMCIVLTRMQTRWSAVGRGAIGRPDDCGR